MFAPTNPQDYMKTWLILLCALSALLWSFAARAQETIDAAKITCNQFNVRQNCRFKDDFDLVDGLPQRRAQQ
jgi:hypothetical protein